MRTAARTASGAVLGLAVAWISISRGEAHKPMTSPFTFNEDVAPILQTQCAGCHAPGGVAPMALLTHEGTVPWGESIRAELLAGHMPPWPVEGPRDRFHNAQVLTARELNVLLTWVAGGTPPGDPSKTPAAAPSVRQWPLGPPDMTLALPEEYTLAADVQEATAEFTIPVGEKGPLWIRAADVQPGTPAIVRGATVRVSPAPSEARAAADPMLAIWVPGDRPVPLDDRAAFHVPKGADLVVSVRYRKTWEYERQAMSDRSTIGIYLSPSPAPELLAIRLAPVPSSDRTNAAGEGEAVSYSTTVSQDVRALAIYPDAALAGARVTVMAARPDGSREELIAFRPRAGWARRYWFAEPVALPRGTTITVRAELTNPLLPPSALPPAPVDPSTIRLTLNVVPASSCPPTGCR